MQVSGILRVGEAAPVAARVARRMSGVGAWRGALWLGFIVLAAILGAAAAIFVGRAFGWSWGDSPMLGGLGVASGAVAGRILGVPLFRKWGVARFRKRFVALGQEPELPLSITIEADTLTYVIGLLEKRARWSAVTELFPVPGYWVFIAQATPFWVPDRFFPDDAARRAFIAEALGHMTDAARKRSVKAEAFIRAKAA
jgi:MFS family permease